MFGYFICRKISYIVSICYTFRLLCCNCTYLLSTHLCSASSRRGQFKDGLNSENPSLITSLHLISMRTYVLRFTYTFQLCTTLHVYTIELYKYFDGYFAVKIP